MSRGLPHPVQIVGRTIVLWGETSRLSDLFGDLTPATEDVGELRTIAVGETRYRKYSGGPLLTRRAHQRTFDTNRGIPNLARPGRRFWVEPPDADILGITIANNPDQFTFQGAWFALKALAFRELPTGWVIRSTGGRAFMIPEGE